MDTDHLTFVRPKTTVNTPTPHGRIYPQQDSENRQTVIVAGITTSENWMFLPGNYEAGTELPSVAILPRASEAAAEEAFLREKRHFQSLRRSALAPYRGSYVAVHGQQIVDSAQDLYSLTNRFFSQYGDVPVYIKFVGDKPKHFVPGPVVAR
jgi:hypothetical protein